MKQRKRVGVKRRGGILAPLFSVYSQNSLGIGDFADLKLLVDFCRKTRNSIIQFLPLNESGSLNCPYDAVSSFALEPAYLALDKIDCANRTLLKEKVEFLLRPGPSSAAHVNYGIKKQKLQILGDVFD